MVMVTGATGHIGNVLVRTLLEKGVNVKVLIKPGSTEIPLDSLNVSKCYGDIRNIDDLRKAFQGVEVVFHLAAVISIFPGVNPELEETNIDGTINVAKVCQELKIKKLIYTSSVHAIANHPHGQCIDETIDICPIRAIGKYGKSKASATLAILDMIKNQGLSAVIVQPSGVIGPHDYFPSQLGLVYHLMSLGLLALGPKGGYNFVDVRDVVNGIILASEKGVIGERYILSGHFLSIKEKKHMVDQILNRRHVFFHVPKFLCYIGAFFLSAFYKPFNLVPILTNESLEILFSNAALSAEKAKKELGYTIRPFNETIEDLLLWIKESKAVWKKTRQTIR